MISNMKCKCTNCGWKGDPTGLRLCALVDMDTREEVETGVYACRECNDHESIIWCCDEQGCWCEATEGTPTSDGYRTTCYKHSPWREQ